MEWCHKTYPLRSVLESLIRRKFGQVYVKLDVCRHKKNCRTPFRATSLNGGRFKRRVGITDAIFFEVTRHRYWRFRGRAVGGRDFKTSFCIRGIIINGRVPVSQDNRDNFVIPGVGRGVMINERCIELPWRFRIKVSGCDDEQLWVASPTWSRHSCGSISFHANEEQMTKARNIVSQIFKQVNKNTRNISQ